MSLASAPVAAAIDILIVEDNVMDVYMIKMALKQAGLTREPMVVDDGAPALALLSTQAANINPVLPDLIILDLNLKRVDGPEVLAHIRRSETLKRMFVAILSSSPSDVMKAEAAEADGYFKKPNDLQGYMALGLQLMQWYRDKPVRATSEGHI